MVHKCKVFCHDIDPDQMDLLGLDSSPDDGKWMPFAFRVDTITMCKMTSDDMERRIFGRTTIFTESGETYIIDTRYEEFLEVFSGYFEDDMILGKEDPDDGLII